MANIIQVLVDNPQLLAAILAIIYNIAGYIMSMLQVKAVEKYDVVKLVEMLVLFEALFTILTTLAEVPVEWTAVITIAVAVIRSLIARLKEYTQTVNALAKPAPA